MANIRMYNFVTTDGFYAGPNDEIDWFDHERIDIDGQENLDHLRPEAPRTLIFGRNTYEMMREYWSSAQDMTILCSGTIVRQFFDAGLLDELELMVIPVILGQGKPLLSPEEISNLALSETRNYQKGIVSRTYVTNI